MRLSTAAMLFCLVPATTADTWAAGAPKGFVLRFPAWVVQPSEDLAIDHLQIVVTCGEIVAVERIPSDWNVGVSRPISAQAGLDASAGHGASSLRDLSEFDGTIVIGNIDNACFKVKATASSMRGEWKREIAGVRATKRRLSR